MGFGVRSNRRRRKQSVVFLERVGRREQKKEEGKQGKKRET